MKIHFISYGQKYYEAEGISPPKHDFLFNLRDLPNPYWNEELRPFTGLEKPVIKFFGENEIAQTRLNSVKTLVLDFINDFLVNENRTDADELIFAFRCTGGKHRSVYFAESICKYAQDEFAAKINEGINGLSLDIEVNHIDVPRYAKA